MAEALAPVFWPRLCSRSWACMMNDAQNAKLDLGLHCLTAGELPVSKMQQENVHAEIEASLQQHEQGRHARPGVIAVAWRGS